MNVLKAVSLLATLLASTALYAAEATSPLPAAQGKGFTQEGKVMAAVGGLTFYEEGKLPLNAPISNWLPQFKDTKVGQVDADGKLTVVPAKNPITVQDLMRHTNGLTYGGRGATPVHKMFPAGSAPAALEYSGDQFINKLASTPLLYEPGTVWDYGFGIDVLGLIEEKIAGKPLGSVLQERVWSKVGMPDTTFQVADKDRARLAQPLPVDPLTGKPQLHQEKFGRYIARN